MARSAPSRQATRAAGRRADRRAEERARRQDERQRRAARSQRVTVRRRQFRRARMAVLVGAATFLLGALWTGAPQPFRQPYVPADEPTASYSVTYAVTYQGGVHNTEQITVQRPWNGKDITRRGGKIVAAELTNDQGLWDWSANGSRPGWFLLSQGRQRAVSDAQPVLPLDWGIDRASAAVVGTDRVAGRTCTRVLTGEPAGQQVSAPTGSSRAELCLDRTGVILRQVWYLNGKLAERMVATSFQPHFTPTADTFAPNPRLPTTGKPPVVSQAIAPDHLKGIIPRLDPPAGFSLGPAYISGQVSGATGQPTFTTKEMYVGPGHQLLELDYGPGPGPHRGIREQLAGGRVGWLSLDLYASSLNVDVNDGASLLMYATDPALLIRAANRLHG
ncbi:MAG TPA: hypothetical protein VFW24_15375 [Acidimicrobiales bacterium]|nr:hypothetical protein [Acidimicrobiales bacterium]